MSYCLGLHIDDNYIRYAKVLKEDNSVPKIETYGIVFYDNLQMAIEGIIKETYSFNIPISINLNGEFYYEFETFAGMDYSNLKKHLKLVFSEEVCAVRNLNPTSFDTKFIRVNNDDDADSTKVVYIACNKSALSKQKQLLGNKISNILPVSLANLSLVDTENQQNFAILDMDTYTTLTIVLKGNVKKVININLGMGNILGKLAQTYKSYSKAYNECKNIILLDEGMQQLTRKRGRPKSNSEEAEQVTDVETITPILYDIAERVRAQLNNYVGIINKVYVTGSGMALNNLDLYLEENLGGIRVELLKPYFLTDNIEVSKKIKEVMEVNSAIALAIAPTKIGKDSINFNAAGVIDEIKQTIKDNKYVKLILSKLPNGKSQKTKVKKIKVERPKVDFSEQSMGYWPKILMFGISMIIVAYVAVTTLLSIEYEKNLKDIENGTIQLKSVINSIENDTNIINMNAQKYVTLQNNIRALSEQLDQINGLSYDVPSLLTRIALVIPDEVALTNLTINDTNVVLEAECDTYAPLGFFISSLKTEEIIEDMSTTIISDSSLQKISISGVIK